MANPKPGEVYWVDLGMAAKYRPLMVVSREDPEAERSLAVCVPLTTEIRGGDYEVPIPRVRWMPGADEGVAKIQGITSLEHTRLERRAGRFDPSVVSKIRDAIAWMLELKSSPSDV
jgi:mRNA interferase MazF